MSAVVYGNATVLPTPGPSMVHKDAQGIAFDLQCYGEEELAEKAKRLSAQRVAAVCERASALINAHGWSTGASWSKGFALAAVEILEGASRPLKRSRRALGEASPALEPRPRKAKPSSVSSQKPRAIYLEVCEAITDAFVNDGFSYRRSRSDMVRLRDDWTERVSFLTSRRKDAGAIELSVSVAASSPKLSKEWTSDSYWTVEPGAYLGQLGKIKGWNPRDLANPRSRKRTIAGIIDGIRSVALPWFDGLHDLSRLARRARSRPLPGIEDARLVVILLAFGLRNDAAEFLRKRRRSRTEEYEDLDEIARRHRLPRPKRG